MSFEKLVHLINPYPKIAGLEFSDSYARFALIEGKEIKYETVKIPAGVIEGGKIKDKLQLISILQSFRQDVLKSKKDKIHVVANISDAEIYTEIFTLPQTASAQIEEAAKLNLQMISPIDFDRAYSDWQIIGQRIDENSGQLEILGAFIPKRNVDDLEEVLSQSGFEAIAVEFSTLALSRALIGIGEGILKEKDYLLLKISGEGVSFGLIRSGNLNFLHFVSWSSLYGEKRTITMEALNKTVVEEMQKVISFQETHMEGKVEELLLITPSFEKELFKIIEENFPNLRLKVPTLKQFNNPAPVWYSVIGSALRGIIPREHDDMISLLKVGVSGKFAQYQTMSFIKMWRNIIIAILGGILAIFLIVDGIFAINKNSLSQQAENIAQNPQDSRMIQLQSEAETFNDKVAVLYDAEQQKTQWAPFFNEIKNTAGSDILISRILIQSSSAPILLMGKTSSQQAIVDFKNKLALLPQISNVDFQPSNVTNEGGKYNFSINFIIKDANGF